MNHLISFVLTFIVFIVVDFIWLTVVAKGLYSKYLYPVIGQYVNFVPALIFYVIYVLGLYIIIILPNLDQVLPWMVIVYGSIFGFVAYATYDLTNLATIKNWPLKITIIDLIWGTFVTAVTTLAGFYIAKGLI